MPRAICLSHDAGQSLVAPFKSHCEPIMKLALKSRREAGPQLRFEVPRSLTTSFSQNRLRDRSRRLIIDKQRIFDTWPPCAHPTFLTHLFLDRRPRRLEHHGMVSCYRSIDVRCPAVGVGTLLQARMASFRGPTRRTGRRPMPVHAGLDINA